MSALTLKDTLHLPKTDFPMRAQLATREPQMLAEWAHEGLWAAIGASREGRPAFVLHDGPPYANGDLHHGHLLNKILKDIILKDRTMAGFRPVFQPGWDCHGLPIETAVDKHLGAKKASLSRTERLGHCRAWAERFVDRQRQGFARLGVFADWQTPYLTMAPAYEADIVRAFADAYASGIVFRGLRPVHWCPRHQTALAEAEVEYEDKRSPSLLVRFDVLPNADLPSALLAVKSPLSLVIWTTTPWSLPGNVAVVVHPEITYVAVPRAEQTWLVAEACYAAFAKAVSSNHGELPAVCDAGWPRVRGSELVGLTYAHPFFDRTGVVLADPFVATDTGTGLVHAAPAHGVDDFRVAEEARLQVVSLVDGAGRFIADAGAFAGLTLSEAGAHAEAELNRTGALLSAAGATIDHRYAHCWRCHEPIITRATEQWFLGLDRPLQGGPTLRERALAALQDIAWLPASGVERIRGMLAGRPDWCLSRQRSWGVSLPIAYCVDCNEPWADPAAMRRAADFVEAHEAAAMLEHDVEEVFGCRPSCGRCGGQAFQLGRDILDVWFDSGVSWLGARGAGVGREQQADLYLEGSDQHRGWFHSSLLTSLVLTGRPPYRACLTHGFVVDGAGKKISKSLGNFVDPFVRIERDGAEIWRLWTASEDYQQDVRLSEAILRQLTDHYRKLRNTVRFLLGNLDGFEPGRDLVQPKELMALDGYVLGKLAELSAAVRDAFASCSFHLGMQRISDFCQAVLSSFYLDALKDRLYASGRHSVARRSGQTAIYLIARDLLRLIAPVLVFTAEEAWRHLPKRKDERDSGSVHTALYPDIDEPEDLAAIKAAAVEQTGRQQELWQLVRKVRRQAGISLEAARRERTLGASTEAQLNIACGSAALAEAKQLTPGAWAELLIVSEVRLAGDAALAADAVELKVVRAVGVKCSRCWLIRTDVGEAAGHENICLRCRQTESEWIHAA